MKKRFIIIISVLLLLCLSIGVGAVAADPIYINSASGPYDGLLDKLYAVGSGGVSLLSGGDKWVLTADGTVLLSTKESEPEDPADSGLAYLDGEIKLRSNKVKVGLNYYYSAYRDTSLSEARLENAVGKGFAFGYMDINRNFVELTRTAETLISISLIEGNTVGVYSGTSKELIYSLEDTDKNNMLAVHPLSENAEAVTWNAGIKYYGDFEFARLGSGQLTVINIVDIEAYAMGVCGSEMSESWPLEALKAQAVAARTYAQKNIKSSLYYTKSGFDLTADTYCQAYSGCSRVGTNITQAVNATANRYITYNGSYIDALYCSSNGGATEDNINVNGSSGYPYLAAKLDPYEELVSSLNYFASWTVEYTSQQLAELAGLNGNAVSVSTVNSNVGNVISITINSDNGTSKTFTKSNCRTALGLYSIRYSVTQNANGNFVFAGSGWGHNLGMSQYGAYSMARYYEKDYKDILGFYYTNVGLSYGV